jgi:hypothetical protein
MLGYFVAVIAEASLVQEFKHRESKNFKSSHLFNMMELHLSSGKSLDTWVWELLGMKKKLHWNLMNLWGLKMQWRESSMHYVSLMYMMKVNLTAIDDV